MGLGDEIMAAGHAMRRHRETGERVAILDRTGHPRRHPLWDGNPAIAQGGEGAGADVVNGSGCRPYLHYPWSKDTGQRFTDWRARDHVARIFFTRDERAFAASMVQGIDPVVVIEPTLKPKANANKDWGFSRYQRVVELLPDLRFVQLGPQPPDRVLPGVRHIATQAYRDALAVLARASAYVGAEGFFHHAAAALGVPAVVLFNPSVPVETLGYPDHVNLGASDSPCGSWRPCAHCRAALDAVTPEQVAEELTAAMGFRRYLTAPSDAAGNRVEIEIAGWRRDA